MAEVGSANPAGQPASGVARAREGAKDARQPKPAAPDPDVVVVAADDDQTRFLIRELQRLRARVRQIWPMQAQLPSDVDIVFCEYTSDLPRRLPWNPGDARAALVAILPTNEALDPNVLCNATPQAVLSKPFSTNAILAAYFLANSQFRYERRLRDKIDKLEDSLRAARIVERAKAILMSTRNINEDEAYNVIRRQAMDRRVPASVVASAIVDSFELIGYSSDSEPTKA